MHFSHQILVLEHTFDRKGKRKSDGKRQSLEEFSYKIEVRKGTLHSNADGLSRGCNGKVCICDDLEQWEKQRNIRKGTKIAGATTLLDDDAIDQALIFPTSCTDGKHQTNECLVAAFKLQPTYTAEELAGFQEKDIDIGPVYKAKLENPDTRPQWNKHSGTGPATKVYLAEYERLEFHNKVLYRRWESNDGLRSHLQFLVPRVLQKEMLEKVHDSKNTAHMGRRRTMYALQNFCYWYKMFEDVVFWISTCQICQRRKPIVPKPRAPMQIYTTGAPYERISMDVCGPLVTTPATMPMFLSSLTTLPDTLVLSPCPINYCCSHSHIRMVCHLRRTYANTFRSRHKL